MKEVEIPIKYKFGRTDSDSTTNMAIIFVRDDMFRLENRDEIVIEDGVWVIVDMLRCRTGGSLFRIVIRDAFRAELCPGEGVFVVIKLHQPSESSARPAYKIPMWFVNEIILKDTQGHLNFPKKIHTEWSNI